MGALIKTSVFPVLCGGPGEVALVGYVGTEEQFQRETNGICQACMDDPFYDGVPQLTFESTFVCEIETTGYISGQLNLDVLNKQDPDAPHLDLMVYTETNPFPEKGFPYLVRHTPGLQPLVKDLCLLVMGSLCKSKCSKPSVWVVAIGNGSLSVGRVVLVCQPVLELSLPSVLSVRTSH
jgi:hypothetical protein